MNETEHQLLSLLSDGEFHSGENIGQQFGMTRSAIWKHMKVLEKRGLEIQSIRRKGYRITGGIELLDRKRIENEFDKTTRSVIKNLLIHDKIQSTNDFLMEYAKNHGTAPTICLAEQQMQGKGRRGRKWISPFATNIYCSFLWRFEKDPSEIIGLSLACAVAVVDALNNYGIKEHIGLKWPNDILWQHKKLAGVLLEMNAEPHGHCSVVIGIGINTRMTIKQASAINQSWTSIEEITAKFPERNRLAGLLIQHVVKNICEFEKNGLTPFLERWQKMDEYVGKPILLLTTQHTIEGVMHGIGSKGELIIQHPDKQLKTYLSGEVSLRPKTSA